MGDQRKEGGPKGGVSSQRKSEEEFAFQRDISISHCHRRILTLLCEASARC